MRVKIDAKVVRTPGIVAAIASGLCYASLWGSNWFLVAQGKELRRQEQAVMEMRQKFNSAAEDVKQIDVYYPRFKSYKVQGIVGEEDRVTWVENLARQARERHVISLTYSVAPPEILVWKTFGKMNGADVYGSAMKVEAGLLHEEELMDLLAGLRAESKGLFSIQECMIDRKGKEGQLNHSGDVANFTGICQLMWYTIKGKDKRWGESS